MPQSLTHRPEAGPQVLNDAPVRLQPIKHLRGIEGCRLRGRRANDSFVGHAAYILYAAPRNRRTDDSLSVISLLSSSFVSPQPAVLSHHQTSSVFSPHHESSVIISHSHKAISH
eukprot:3137597-Pyramimonas_sp.AAC.1